MTKNNSTPFGFFQKTVAPFDGIKHASACYSAFYAFELVFISLFSLIFNPVIFGTILVSPTSLDNMGANNHFYGFNLNTINAHKKFQYNLFSRFFSVFFSTLINILTLNYNKLRLIVSNAFVLQRFTDNEFCAV